MYHFSEKFVLRFLSDMAERRIAEASCCHRKLECLMRIWKIATELFTLLSASFLFYQPVQRTEEALIKGLHPQKWHWDFGVCLFEISDNFRT